MDARIDPVPARGRGGCNTWLVGDDDEVIVVDPGTDADEVLAAAGEREILAVICTHGHAGHVAAAPAVAAASEAPVFLHPADTLAWQEAELLTLPEDTMVLPGHGEQITIGLAGRRFDAWAAGA
jgi:glyoxylase-like metal-dependent hydrolase (beta-lactamase superfamily II)